MRKIKRKQLKYKDRVAISLYIQEGYSNIAIAEKLGRNPSSIMREINRHKGSPARTSYDADFAHNMSTSRRRIANSKNPKKSEHVWAYVEEKLRDGWSPELISGRITLDDPGLSVSYETIYQHVYKKWTTLAGFLPRRRSYRRTKSMRKAQRSMIPNRLSILERPEFINNRSEVGHWEADSIVCKQSNQSINVMIERKTRLVKITKLSNMSPKTTQKVIIDRLTMLPRKLRKSITYDNGIENRNHESISSILGLTSYFCEPYHSWEKGAVENVNRLIRRYIPKKSDLSLVTPEQLTYIENKLNNRPKKCLDYQTPIEVFNTYSL